MSCQREIAAQQLLPHFTRASAWHSDQWPLLIGGEGCWVFDDRGRRLLDGLSGLFCVNLGYGRGDLVQAAAQQLETLPFASNWGMAHSAAVEAAQVVARLAPGDLDVVFFVNSGSEAVESAIKFARQYHLSRGQTRRWKVISRDLAYHGTTLGALSAAGLPRIKSPFEPLLQGFRQVSSTRAAREVQAPAEVLVAELERLVVSEGPETVAAIIAEPVQNGGGAIVPPPGYWQGLREVCDRYGVLLVADEVICGFGRLGEWFGSHYVDVLPDLITFAKGATSGYVPMGGMVAKRTLVEGLWEGAGTFSHGATFGGHPVACSVLMANVAAIEREGVLGNVRRLAPKIKSSLYGLMSEHPSVGEVRGEGFLWAVEFVAQGDTQLPLTEEQSRSLMTEVLPQALSETELIARPDDRGGTMLVLAPPLVADDAVLGELIDRLDSVLGKVDAFMSIEASGRVQQETARR